MNVANFKADLRELMQKHGVVGLGAEIDGDTHGITEKFVVDYKDSHNRTQQKVIYSCCGYVDQSDLK
jgi:hypothetical protein